MKNINQIVEFVLLRIGHIYHRPLMFGGSAEGVDLILNYYHEILAEIFEKQDEYRSINRSVHSDQNCGSATFAFRYRANHKSSNEKEISEYVVSQWMIISERLGLQIPREMNLPGITEILTETKA